MTEQMVDYEDTNIITGSPEMLPKSLHGLDVHFDQIRRVTKVKTELSEPELYLIFFEGTQMPFGYWYNVGDGWEITFAELVEEPRGGLPEVLGRLFPDQYLKIAVVSSENHD